MMQRQLMHLVRLVDDLLDISRITSRKITLEKKRVDLREIFHSALEATEALMRERGHRLETELPAHSLIVHADPIRLAQVVANLLNNAARYTAVGGQIRLRAARVNDAAVVQIADNGAGIEPHMLDSVFEMFVQGQSTRQSQGGLGIGLTLVRRLVEMHGGTVSAASGGKGLGSTFTVTLPLAGGADVQPGFDADANSTAPAARRILVVDDNVDAADSLAMLLQVEGHSTRVANDGPEALALAVSFRPDVVILDIGMPGMNGHEVARRLRANPELPPGLKLVALTGWGSVEDRQKAEAAGFDVHLVKPVEPERLRAIVS
jgi:CheY-like chemotaxis protein/two-component sensor histidine kinase